MMKRTPAKAVSLVLVLVMLLSLLTVGAAAEESGWWAEEVWNDYFKDVNFGELADALDSLNNNG